MAVLLAVEGAAAIVQLGATGFYWLLGGTAVIVGLCFLIAFRSWTTVGAAGITICWGFGRGRTHPWHEIRWIDVRETKAEYGVARVARITLANGRRRSLPALQHSDTYPRPDFDVDFRRVVNWWELSTDQAARVRPPLRKRDRVSPMALGLLLGLLITVVVVAVVVMQG
ncbi:hypothetical protein ACSNOH_26015 [Streptomyces sp. URMC 127]|uniref:hypothetical protein n=1 Tax=Streptomyces sp. URMC 127 TaxID=3423402 RepID=UPI003F19388C